MSGLADILTANALLSGQAVYLTEDGRWLADIGSARLFFAGDAEARDREVAIAKTDMTLIGIEIEQVEKQGNRIVAVRLRERIRANGPTIAAGPADTGKRDRHVSV